MGRIFETRKATMFKRWDRMAKAFTRCGKEIAIAVKAGGPEADNNPALRRAIQNARGVNMPKDKIQAAIDKAMGGSDGDYAEVIYEGYAPHGVAVMVVTATDNPTRTVANVRSHFKKGGGAMGNSGSVAFGFEKLAVFKVDPADVEMDEEELELELIDFGLEELGQGTDDDGNAQLVIRATFTEFGTMQEALEARNIEVKSSGAEYIPANMVEVSDEQAEEVLGLIDRLEQDDDVQDVFHNLA